MTIRLKDSQEQIPKKKKAYGRQKEGKREVRKYVKCGCGCGCMVASFETRGTRITMMTTINYNKEELHRENGKERELDLMTLDVFDYFIF